MQISRRLISDHPNNYLPSQNYDMKNNQSIIIYPWNTYNTTYHLYQILKISDSADFDILVFILPFCFAWIPHPSMAFHYNFLTRDI